jgi:hypothetical protein
MNEDVMVFLGHLAVREIISLAHTFAGVDLSFSVAL